MAWIKWERIVRGEGSAAASPLIDSVTHPVTNLVVVLRRASLYHVFQENLKLEPVHRSANLSPD